LAGQRAFTLRPVSLVARRASLPAVALARTPPLVLPPAAKALAVSSLLLHGTQLVERALHGLHGPIALSLVQRLPTFAEVSGVAWVALATETLHLLQELAQLVGRELLALEAAAQSLRFLEDHALLVLGEVALEVREPVDLLQHANAFVALLEEGVEIRRLSCDGSVLEDCREITRLGRPAHARPRPHRALLHLGAAHVFALGRFRLVLALEISRAVLRLLLLFFLPRPGEAGQRALRPRDGGGRGRGRGRRPAARARSEPRGGSASPPPGVPPATARGSPHRRSGRPRAGCDRDGLPTRGRWRCGPGARSHGRPGELPLPQGGA